MITVTQAAKKAKMNPRYIRAEIDRGNLKAEKVGSQWLIKSDDFQNWLDNPRRGSRSK